MAKPLLSTAGVMAMLRANPLHLAELARGVPPQLLRAASAPSDWSANEILAHLRTKSDGWGGSITLILAGDGPTDARRPLSPGWKLGDYPKWEFGESLRAFAVQREGLLGILQSLSPDDWERTAPVPPRGQADQRTVHWYASKLAAHERRHLQQVERALRRASRT